MKRLGLAPIFLSLALSIGIANAQPRQFNRGLECRYASLDQNPRMNVREVRKTIACAVRHMPVSGGLRKALYIAGREGGFYYHAYNPSGASGVYQVIPSTWHHWTQLFANWRHQHHISAGVFRGRANVLISVRAAHQWGWGSWGG